MFPRSRASVSLSALAQSIMTQPRRARKVGRSVQRPPGPINATWLPGSQPIRTVSMEIEPPSNPSTGKLTSSSSLCSAIT